MSHGLWFSIYAALFCETMLVSLALVPLTIRLAFRLGSVAQPGSRHLHQQPTPALGGLAIVGSFVIVLLGNLTVAHFFHNQIAETLPQIGQFLVNIPSILIKLTAIVGGASLMSLLGFVDDRHPLPALVKLAVMFLATVPLIATGAYIQAFPAPWMGAVLTIVWVVFLTNSFNFLDCMDGVCAGVAMIVCFAFGMIYFFAGQWFMTAMFALLAGALAGFLRSNFPPARLFMGDTGSLFIGYIIGALSALGSYYEAERSTILAMLTPLIVLGVPVFDTLSVMWIRHRNGKPLMQGDLNHIPHRMRDLGMSTRGAVRFLYFLTAAVALAAVPLRRTDSVGAMALLAQVFLMFWIIHRLERTAQKQRSEN